jgi:hypothetical protein
VGDHQLGEEPVMGVWLDGAAALFASAAATLWLLVLRSKPRKTTADSSDVPAADPYVVGARSTTALNKYALACIVLSALCSCAHFALNFPAVK